MPQYRKLHTKTVESLDVNDMPDDFTRLLWLLLPLIVCREGRGIDSPDWVKAKAMPLRGDVSAKRITEAMTWYARRGMIVRYAVEGRRYFQIVNWARYQGDTSRESESNYPAPEKDAAGNLLLTNSGVTPDQLAHNSCSYSDAYTDTNTDAYTTATTGAEIHERKATKKPRTAKQPAIIPPAVSAFREAARRMPNKATWEGITEAVGDSEQSLGLWGQVVSGYIAMGWNPGNVAGMLEFFKRGEVPMPRRNGHNGADERDRPNNWRAVQAADFMLLESESEVIDAQ